MDLDDEDDSPEAETLEHVKQLAEENDQLRKSNGDLLKVQLALLEAKSELELECRASNGNRKDGEVQDEWREMLARLHLLLTENTMLEGTGRQAQRELQAAQQSGTELQRSLTEALGSAQVCDARLH